MIDYGLSMGMPDWTVIIVVLLVITFFFLIRALIYIMGSENTEEKYFRIGVVLIIMSSLLVFLGLSLLVLKKYDWGSTSPDIFIVLLLVALPSSTFIVGGITLWLCLRILVERKRQSNKVGFSIPIALAIAIFGLLLFGVVEYLL